MGCFQDVFDEMFPMDWLDPYGRMPLNPGASVSVDIEMTENDGIKRVSAVKTPPRADNMSFGDALSMVLSITEGVSEPLCRSLQAADQGKRDDKKSEKSDEKDSKNEDDVVQSNPQRRSDSGNRDRNLWSDRKSDGSSQTDDCKSGSR